MRLWIFLIVLYLLMLAAGLLFPVLGRLDDGSTGWVAPTLYFAAVGALILGPIVMVMMTARSMFPNYWWLAHIDGKDIYEYDGVYFIGSRTTRQKARLARIVFGLDETMRRWHLVFGLLALALMVPHLMGGYTTWRFSERLVPKQPVLQETLHASTLSSLPVMKKWNRTWKAGEGLAGEVKQELAGARKSNKQEPSQWFYIAQLRLLNAFQVRTRAGDPFLRSPGERMLFNRVDGAEAAAYLKRILDLPEQKRKGWTRGALALTGFFHLSDQNPKLAAQFFDRALMTVEDNDRTGITRHQVVLLAAQTALTAKDAPRAEMLLEKLLTAKGLPDRNYAQAVEHFAAALHMKGQTEQVNDLLNKALEVYTRRKDRAGIARVHLRLAALALGEDRVRDASHELSLAASLANGLEDGFTLNMVEGLSQFFPRVL